MLCSPAIGAGLGLRADAEEDGSWLATLFVFVLVADPGVRGILGVGGRGAAKAVCRESWEMEARSSWSLVVDVEGGRGGSVIGVGVSGGPEPLTL